jgi:hypothetical protein
MDGDGIPLGLCHCGCGERTSVAPMTNSARGYVKGQPYRYIRGHARRRAVIEFEVDEQTQAPSRKAWCSIISAAIGHA